MSSASELCILHSALSEIVSLVFNSWPIGGALIRRGSLFEDLRYSFNIPLSTLYSQHLYSIIMDVTEEEVLMTDCSVYTCSCQLMFPLLLFLLVLFYCCCCC